MPSLMKARSGVLNSNIGGNALAPLFSTGALTLSAGVITDVTRLAGVEGDGEAYPFGGVYVGPAAANLGDTVGDMSFESLAVGSNMATDGWVNSTGGTAAISDDVVKFGTKSGKLTTGGASLYQRLELPFTSTPGTYTWAVWLYAPSPLTKVRLAFGGPTDGAVLSNELAVGDEWVQFSVTKTITVTETVKATIYVSYGVNTSGAVLYVSGPMPVLSPIALPFTPTSRVAGTVAAPRQFLNPDGGGVAIRLRHGVSYTTSTRPRILNAISGNHFIVCYYDTGGDKWLIARDNGSGVPDIVYSAVQSFVAGDTQTLILEWTSAALTIQVDDAAPVTAAGTKVPLEANLPATFGLGSASEYPLGNLLWAYGWSGVLSTADRALLVALGNNDPLPHQLRGGAAPSFLAPFNGDGTLYRYAA